MSLCEATRPFANLSAGGLLGPAVSGEWGESRATKTEYNNTLQQTIHCCWLNHPSHPLVEFHRRLWPRSSWFYPLDHTGTICCCYFSGIDSNLLPIYTSVQSHKIPLKIFWCWRAVACLFCWSIIPVAWRCFHLRDIKANFKLWGFAANINNLWIRSGLVVRSWYLIQYGLIEALSIMT